MAEVELSNVVKTYGDVTAVAGISLTIAHGEFVALLGPSGCGKTTTLQMLAGFADPSSGEIRIGNASVAGVPPHKRNIGVVFQSYALFPHLTVFDNIGFGLRMRKLPKAEIGERVQKALDIVQLTKLEDRYPRQLSGGQQQRVALARALVIEPTVLLLDEPLSNLDANLREQMRFEIREIQKRIGITTVFVTHDQGEAMAAADRLVVMEHGRIRQVGTVREIYHAPANPFVAGFIGQSNLLHGTVVQLEGGRARIRLADQQEISAKINGEAAEGDSVVLVLRPEDLTVSDRPVEGMNNLAGTVTRISFLGSSINVGIRVGEHVLSIVGARDMAVPPEGQPASVAWPESDSVVFVGEPK